EPERQLGSLRDVIGNIRSNGGAPSIESLSTELSGMHSAQRASALLALQQTHGNQYVQRVVTGIQAKLAVGQPSDIYEQEADRVADAVMRMPEPRMQRQPEEENEEEKKKKEKRLLQAKPLAEQITPLVQRQPIEEEEEAEELPSMSEFRLTPPSLSLPGLNSPHFPHLELEMPMQNTLRFVERRLDPTLIRPALLQIDPGLLTPPSPTTTGAVLEPAETPPSESTPLVPAGPGPETPREASGIDIIRAVVAVPAVDTLLTNLQTGVLDRAERDWGRLSMGERIATITATVVIGGGALAGVLSHPETRQLAIDLLNGRTFPVPGVEGLQFEVGIRGNDWTVGFHLDVGALLPASLGFGPSSPSAFGPPPIPEGGSESESGATVQRQMEEPQLQRQRDDAYAQQVMKRIQAKKGSGHPLDPETRNKMEAAFGHDFNDVRVQRQPEEEEELKKKEKEEEEILLTRGHIGQTPEVTTSLESHIRALKGGGQPLLESVRTFFEPRFGYDFSQVLVHTDTRAAESAGAVNAQAFTIGQDVVFGEGQYSPQTSEGKQLLAHELTHVVQQGRGQGSLQNIIQCLQFRRPTVGDPYFIYELDRAISNYTLLARYYGTTTSRIRAANRGINPTRSAHIRVPALNPPAPMVGMFGGRGQLGKITSRVDIKWSPHADSNKIGRLPRESYIPEVFSVINGFTSLYVDPSSLQDRADGIVTELTARGLISGPSSIGNHVLGYAPAGNVRRIPLVPAPEALAAVSVASAERGVVEDPPCKNLGSDVEKYLRAVGLGPRIIRGVSCGYAWCAAFVKWCLEDQAGVTTGLTGAARSVRTWGSSRGWYHEISDIRPIEGDIFFIEPGDTSPSGDPFYIPNHLCDIDPCVSRGPGSGHCGFVLSVSGNTIRTIEGNVHISETNDGVASKTRNISQLAGIVRIQP
ncbi:protein of unknown function (DUF4157), partial [Candidatus Methanophagaceae archaeon]